MSTLEKTIDILTTLPEDQVEIIYSYAQFLNSQQLKPTSKKKESVNDILHNLTGILTDSGKTLEQYREERMKEKYETTN